MAQPDDAAARAAGLDAPACPDEAVVPMARASSGQRLGHTGEEEDDEYRTGLERFDKTSVQRVMRITVASGVVVVVLIIVFWVDDNDWEIPWLVLAWLTVLWSLTLLVSWLWKAPAAILCPPIRSLLEVTPRTCSFIFSIIFYIQLVCWLVLVITFTYVTVGCYNDMGIAATNDRCLRRWPNEWKTILTALYLTMVMFPLFIVNQCCLLLASKKHSAPPTVWQRIWHPGQVLLQLVLLLGWSATTIGYFAQCDFDNLETSFRDDHFLRSDTQLEYACNQNSALRDSWFWPRWSLGCVWTVYFITVLLRLYAFGRGFCIFKFGGCCYGLCCCPGEDLSLARWALLRSHFLVIASMPACICWIFSWLFQLFNLDQTDDMSKRFLVTIIFVYSYNIYIFGCLPAGIERFLCIRITYLNKTLDYASSVARVYYAFLFANDAYFDDTELAEPSKSASGWLDYQRAGMNQQAGVVFISDKETDTHAHLTVTEPDDDDEVMLVVAFRGTGLKSWANIKTDCTVVRTEMELTPDGLQFNAEAKDEGLWRDAIPAGMELEVSMMHAGFVKAYLTVRDRVLEAHRRLVQSYRIDKVLVCGHSLGGALSTIYTTELLARKIHSRAEVWMITFGSPRVGNKTFARLFAELTERAQCLRVVHRGDFIVGIPKFWAAFKHVGVELEIWVDDDGACKMIFDPSPLERSFLTADHNNFIKHRRKFYFPTLEQFVRSFSPSGEVVHTMARHQKLGGAVETHERGSTCDSAEIGAGLVDDPLEAGSGAVDAEEQL